MEQEKGDLNSNIMENEQKTINNSEMKAAPVSTPVASVPPQAKPGFKPNFNRGPRSPRPFFGRPRASKPGEGEQGDEKGFRKNPRKPGHREARIKPEFDQKIIDIRRVARVVAGGRRFSFSVTLVAGDKKGKVGVGTGKAGDTSLAIDKAMRDAKKNMIKINTTKDMSIAHDIKAKFSSARVLIMPAPGRGIIAGSSVRNVIELAGLKNIVGKVLSGSKNKVNIAKVAIKALSEIAPAREVISKK